MPASLPNEPDICTQRVLPTWCLALSLPEPPSRKQALEGPHFPHPRQGCRCWLGGELVARSACGHPATSLRAGHRQSPLAAPACLSGHPDAAGHPYHRHPVPGPVPAWNFGLSHLYPRRLHSPLGGGQAPDPLPVLAEGGWLASEQEDGAKRWRGCRGAEEQVPWGQPGQLSASPDSPEPHQASTLPSGLPGSGRQA